MTTLRVLLLGPVLQPHRVRRRLPAPYIVGASLAIASDGRYSPVKLPRIEILANCVGRHKEVDAPEGGDLLDICDEILAPIPFSCRSATCGTCHVEVLEGGELLEPPEPHELELLELLGSVEDHRLACQARVRPGDGVVRLRAVLAG